MSGDQLATSFPDISPRPPTPKRTPTSAVFPSPVFETPKPNQGSVNESGGWTPRFAEEYSVFNSTPGNLRGSQGPFVDFGPSTPANGHKRLLSVEGLAAEIATHVNHFSPNPNLPLPPVDPSRRLASSPNSLTVPKEYTADSKPQPSPNTSKPHQSTKKARRGTVTDSVPTQTATPPPTGHRVEHKLALKLNMQNDQSFGQPDFTGGSQQHDLAALMAASGDMFGYPMSAPAGGPATYWDPSTMGMDLDFSVPATTNVFQTTPAHSHRHTGSFDWNSEIQLFQHPSAPSVPLQSTNQENVHQVRQDRPIAPQPPVSQQATMAANAAMAAAFSAPMDDPFGIMAPGEAVDPGLLFSRPPSSSMNSNFLPVATSGSAEAAIAESGSRTPIGDELRKSASAKDIRNGKLPDRAFANSPVKNNRPGLGRSVSENRGRKPQNRPVLPKLAPAIRPVSQASSTASVEPAIAPAPAPLLAPARPIARPSGRSSPLKSQHRLSSLGTIPESSLQPRTRTSVRFTIDAHGRARAETTIVNNEPDLDGSIRYRNPSRERSWQDMNDSLDDDSSSDDEPIIIPSRNNSFNASFALPDPLRPVGSIFHSSRRSVSDRSTSSFAHDSANGSQHDVESEAETVTHERRGKVGDAASELRKVIEDRQKRSSQMGNSRSQRFLQPNHPGSFRGDTISPSNLTDSSLMTDRQDFRCVCSRKSYEEGDGFMVQW
ncbi:hypothetical protein B0T10DRAFT_583948 [Thelonectria olida]|uniref:PHD finger domain protein n=1 Tax=Thelonectria olida TaxID=1576542 RepID=A0A9P8WE19_9HYPO|nr:hypothetical protein B0T10DRAFT_583948 [Thelonectria olida]